MVKKQFAFEELTYLDTTGEELKKMIDLHIDRFITPSLADTPSYVPPQAPSIPPTVSIAPSPADNESAIPIDCRIDTALDVLAMVASNESPLFPADIPAVYGIFPSDAVYQSIAPSNASNLQSAPSNITPLSPADTPAAASILPSDIPAPVDCSSTFVPRVESIYNNKNEMTMPRIDRKGECEIKIHTRKQAGFYHQTMTILTAKQ